MGDSRQSVQTLQSQLDEFRDRSRRDLQDAQRLSKDRLTELQRAQASNKNLQEEVRLAHVLTGRHPEKVAQRRNKSREERVT